MKTINASSYIHTPPPTPPTPHIYRHTDASQISVFIYVWQRCRMGWVGGGGGVSRRKMICCGYECLTDPLECSPSIRLHPPTCSLPPITSPCAVSLAVAAAPARSEPPPTPHPPRPGRSGDGGLSAELEQKAGAPNLPDGALEAEERGTLLFYHLCVSIKGTHFGLTFTARYVQAVNTLSRMFQLHRK